MTLPPSSRARQCPGNARRRWQAGYLLLETTIVTALLASAVVAYMALQSAQTRLDQGQAVGAHYARINEALGQYMTLHHVALKKMSPECSAHGLALNNSQTKPTLSTACVLTVNGQSVNNGLQPSVAELVALSLLPASTTDALQLAVRNAISEPHSDGTAASDNWTRARLQAVISQRCVATQSAGTLQGRYVLIRRPVATDTLALDEIEVMVNGSNVAGSAVLSTSPPFDDGAANAAAYYAPGNLVDRLQTRAPGTPYQVPGLFRSLPYTVTAVPPKTPYRQPGAPLPGTASSTAGPWVQLDLGMQRDISSIGLRSAQGSTSPGATGSTWAAEGSSLSVSVNSAPADSNGNFLTTTTSQIRQASATGLLPGNMVYVSSDAFSAGSPLSLTPTPQGCPNGSLMALNSLLFNTQPYELDSLQGSGAMLATVSQAAGAEAAMSDPVNGGELTNRIFSTPNPLRYFDPDKPSDTTGVGVRGIIAVRNGYDSYSTSLQTRADGSNLPTAAWNFNNKNLTGVESFESASANVRGDLATQGALSANKAAFNEVKLPQASAGNACSQLSQSIALNSDGQMLTCADNLWKSALSGTLNTREYHEVWITQQQGQASGQMWFCDALSCSTPGPITVSSPTQVSARIRLPASSAEITTVTTTLKSTEWFPVMLGVGDAQSVTSTPNSFDSFLFFDTQGPHWSISIHSTFWGLGRLRFYKINP
jgi:hypothetical protein